MSGGTADDSVGAPHRQRVIEISPPTEEARRLWTKLAEIAVEFGADQEWSLVGGLMVQLLAYEHGVESRPTTDIDVLGNARKHPSVTKQLAETLERLGARMADPPMTDPKIGYRFEIDGEMVEILGSDGLTENPQTLGTYETIQVNGGSQALHRTEKVLMSVSGAKPVAVRRPRLLAAILLKARAMASARARLEAHREDLIRLLSFVDDPTGLAAAESLTKSEKQWLRKAEPDLTWDHAEITALFPAELLLRARQAFDLLVI